MRSFSSRDKCLLRELSDELDKLRMDSRERETVLINDLTKSRSNAQELKEELQKAQEKLTQNLRVMAEGELFAKEVSEWMGSCYKHCSK